MKKKTKQKGGAGGDHLVGVEHVVHGLEAPTGGVRLRQEYSEISG